MLVPAAAISPSRMPAKDCSISHSSEPPLTPAPLVNSPTPKRLKVVRSALRKRTEPSPKANCDPPECLLPQLTKFVPRLLLVLPLGGLPGIPMPRRLLAVPQPIHDQTKSRTHWPLGLI